MSEYILYSPVCFHGIVSKIFKLHGLCLRYRMLEPGRVLNAILHLAHTDS